MRSTSLHLKNVARGIGDHESRPWMIFVVAGTAFIVAGGFVAAAGGEAPSKHLSWAAAYLVLVCGVVQVGLGGGRALMTPRPSNTKLIARQFLLFNLANAGVLVGTLARISSLLYASSAIFLVALGLFALDARGVRTRERKWMLVYRVFILLLAVSVPIGAILGR